ncbi:MAG: O-antigen ligase family protein [Anaerolineae bacterium]
MTTVGRFCEKFIEAGWLVVPVLVATFLNPFSDQVFEPDKAALLQILVTLMVAAWVIRSIESSAFASSRLSRETSAGHTVAAAIHALRVTPIAVLALVLLLVSLASTITSISPRLSWWGSYERTQGTYALLTYLGLFFVVLSVLQRADQLHHLITVLLFTSFPVAVYAILQRYGMSLLQFSEVGVEVRVISTLGNAIFLAAYLAMVMPLTLWRLLKSAGGWSGRPIRSALTSLLYGGLFVLQLAAVVFTQSRGPILGLLVELFVFVLLVALLRGQRRWALAGVFVAVAAVAFLVILNIPGLPTEPLRSLPYVARFSRLASSEGITVKSRVLAWDTVLDTMRADPSRILLGYGPETMKPVFTKFMPVELWVLQGGGQYGTFDRAHNAVFDVLFSNGTLGVVAYLLLYSVVLYRALQWLGLVQTRPEARGLIGLLVGGAVLGLIIPWLWRGDLVLAGVGVPAGIIAGMVVYLLGKVVLSPAAESDGGDMRLLQAALLAAIVGHFVETQTGIGIVVTHSYFWVYTALIILLGTGRINEPEPARSPALLRRGSGSGARDTQPGGRPVSRRTVRSRLGRSRRGRSRGQGTTLAVPAGSLGPVVAMALVSTVLLGTLSYAFVHGFNVSGARGPAQALIWATWLFTGLIILLERDRFATDVSSLSGDALVYAMTSLVWLLPFALFHRVNAQTLDRLNTSYLAFVAWLLVTVVGIAATLQWSGASSRRVVQSNRPILSAAIAFSALLLVWKVDITRIQADIYEKVGKTTMEAGLWGQATPNLQRAATLQPWQDQYYIYLGGAYVEQARMASEVATKDVWMEQARQIFEQGWVLSPRDSDHQRQLGLMYHVWADWAPDETTRRQRLQNSLRHYLAAVDLNPHSPDLRLDLADAYFALRMNEEALAQYQHAVDSGSPEHLGRAYAGSGDIYLTRGQLERAAEAYRRAMQAGRDRQEVLRARIRAVNDYPDDVQVRESLALVYAASDRQGDALKELNAALTIASSDAERTEVEKLIGMIEE